MWSEEFDKKIRGAAENDSPAFNEKAWDSMLPLLDQHLPREKKRRWAILWFFGLLISATAIFFIVKNNSERTSGISKQQSGDQQKVKEQSNPKTDLNSKDNLASTDPKQLIPTGSEDESINTPVKNDELNSTKGTSDIPLDNPNTKREKEIEQRIAIEKNEKQPAFQPSDVAETNPTSINKKTKPKKINARVGNESIAANRQTPVKSKKSGTTKDRRNITDENTQRDKDNNVTKKDSPIPDDSVADQKKSTTIPGKDSTVITDLAKKTDTKTTAIPDTTSLKTEPVVSKKKQSASKSSRFSISISAGPDISSVGENVGKVKMQYGLGIGYEINKRFTVRTGFYVSRKIYTADSADYHPPKSFWTYFDNLQSIDANCLVYEIPLSVVYNFRSSNKNNWFVSGGVSSYLMKKEKYGYSYKNSWNQPEYYSRTYKNENNHFFSVLNISGGYRHEVSKSFSLLAEPYLRMPLSGVGFGKVKLNSGGIIITASFKPFLKRK